MELEQQIKLSILGLASEDAYASWELWGTVNQDTANMQVGKEVLREKFLDIMENLAKEKKIIAFDHKESDNSYIPAVFNRERLEKEMKQANEPNPDTFYWFEATDEGNKEYRSL